jgi:hypothetical protein
LVKLLQLQSFLNELRADGHSDANDAFLQLLIAKGAKNYIFAV